jgi:HPt (histidine-containing phosphotransfer) domain-containing protein
VPAPEVIKLAMASETAAPPAPAPEAATLVPPVEEPSEPPVEMERLNEFSDGDTDSLRELVELFLKQTAQQLAQLETAVRDNNAEEVRRVAHSCAGASATLGMTRFVPLLRDLEKQGASGTLITAAQVYQATAREFKHIQNFLTARLNLAETTPAPVNS